MAENVVYATNPERYVFARYLRRMVKQRGMTFSQFREAIGASRQEFNWWMKDAAEGSRGRGRPSVPDEETCREIARVLDVSEDFVIKLAIRAQEAMDDPIALIRAEDGVLVEVEGE